MEYTLTGRQAGSLYNVKLELASAFPDTSRPASMASTWQVACLAYDFVRFLYRPLLVAHRVLPLTGGPATRSVAGAVGLGSCCLADASREGAEVAHGEPIQRGQCEFTIFGFLLCLDLGAQGGKIFVMA